MNNVITHPRFDRPAVHQPCPRRRKGTVNFRRRSAWIRMRRAEPEPVPAQETARRVDRALETVRKVIAHEDARKLNMLPLYLANDLASLRIMHALRGLGIELDFNSTCNAFIMRAADERGPQGAA